MPNFDPPTNLGPGGGDSLQYGSGGITVALKQHTIQKSYAGGGTSPISVSVTYSGESEMNHSGPAAGSGTTTFGVPFVMNPATALQCAVFQADGNCTLTWDGSGTDVTIPLTANTPLVLENITGTMPTVPSGSDTITLKVSNASASSITFESRMLYN